MIKHVVTSVALVALGLTVSLHGEILEQVLVKVNGDIVTKSDFERMQVEFLRQRPELQNVTADSPELQKAVAESTPQLILGAVDELLLVQRGRELGYVMTDENFKSVLDNIKKENKMESEEQFQAALKAENMTLADLRRNLERQMIQQRVQQNEVLGKIGVTDEEARRYYETHMNEFTSAPSVTLREILVSVPTDPRGVNAAADDAAKDKAEEIRKRVTTGGESFEKLATDASDSPSKANAGLIGPLSVNDISPELRKLIEAMKPGDVAELIRTQRGYQILKLEAMTSAETMTLEQAREQISERVFTDKRKAEFQKYLEKLRAQAIIEWKNEDVRKAFEEGLKQLQAAPPAP